MEAAGLDMSHYRAHSSRSASATDMVKKGFSLSQILSRAHWSENSGTFQRFYNRALPSIHVDSISTFIIFPKIYGCNI